MFDIIELGYDFATAYHIAEKHPRTFAAGFSQESGKEMKGEIELQPESISQTVTYKGQGRAETELFIDEIAESKMKTSPYSPKITITLSNDAGESGEGAIIVDVKAEGGEGYTQFRPFQFIATAFGGDNPYASAFNQLTECINDWMNKTGYDPLT